MTTVSWSPDQRIIAAGCNDGTIVLIEDAERIVPGMQLATPKVTLAAHQPSTVNEITWSPDGMMFASVGDDAWFHIWNWDGSPTGIAFPFLGSATSVDWSSDGRHLAVGEYFAGQGTAHVMEMLP